MSSTLRPSSDVSLSVGVSSNVSLSSGAPFDLSSSFNSDFISSLSRAASSALVEGVSETES